MWRIFKAELLYNKNTLLLSYSIIFFIALTGLVLEVDPNILNTGSWMVYVYALTLMAHRVQKEKRERFFGGLPAQITTVAASRLLILFFVYTTLSVLWLFPYTIEYSVVYDKKLGGMLASNFLILSSIMFAIVGHDLSFHPAKKYRNIFLSSVAFYFVFLMSLALVIALIKKKIVPEFASIFVNWPMLILMVVCFIPIPVAIYLSLISFTKRTSFA